MTGYRGEEGINLSIEDMTGYRGEEGINLSIEDMTGYRGEEGIKKYQRKYFFKSKHYTIIQL